MKRSAITKLARAEGFVKEEDYIRRLLAREAAKYDDEAEVDVVILDAGGNEIHREELGGFLTEKGQISIHCYDLFIRPQAVKLAASIENAADWRVESGGTVIEKPDPLAEFVILNNSTFWEV